VHRGILESSLPFMRSAVAACSRDGNVFDDVVASSFCLCMGQTCLEFHLLPLQTHLGAKQLFLLPGRESAVGEEIFQVFSRAVVQSLGQCGQW